MTQPTPKTIIKFCVWDGHESDVVRHYKYGGDHIVKWIAESCGFFIGKESWSLTALCSPNIQVVGNIYDPTNT